MSDVDLSKLATEEGIEIAPGVRVRLRSLADYRQNEENPVSHTPRNLGAVVESIHKVGAARSGFASKGKILAGNLTWDAMTEVGIEGIIEVTTDGTKWVMVNREDLTEEQEKQEKQAAYGDQQGSFLADWDIEQILVDIEAEVDLSGLFTPQELELFPMLDEEIYGEGATEGRRTNNNMDAMRNKMFGKGEYIRCEIGEIMTSIPSTLYEQVFTIVQAANSQQDGIVGVLQSAVENWNS